MSWYLRRKKKRDDCIWKNEILLSFHFPILNRYSVFIADLFFISTLVITVYFLGALKWKWLKRRENEHWKKTNKWTSYYESSFSSPFRWCLSTTSLFVLRNVESTRTPTLLREVGERRGKRSSRGFSMIWDECDLYHQLLQSNYYWQFWINFLSWWKEMNANAKRNPSDGKTILFLLYFFLPSIRAHL